MSWRTLSTAKENCRNMQSSEKLSSEPPKRWMKAGGGVVSCTEKVKVLEENWNEVRSLLQDALDDAVLMGCSQAQVKAEFKRLVDALECGYKEGGQ